MSTIAAYAAPDAGAPLERTTIERRSVREHDVLIEIKYVGICHSDIHQARGDWGQKLFPMVPGHEIAGLVTEVGPGVTKHAVGDRLGSTPVGSARTAGPAWSSSAPADRSRPTTASTSTASGPTAATRPTSSSTRTS